MNPISSNINWKRSVKYGQGDFTTCYNGMRGKLVAFKYFATKLGEKNSMRWVNVKGFLQ